MHFSLRRDLRASLVVTLVALPLCLGIALASGAPLISGLVAGIVGGIVVGALSKSPLSVSGPAAGLTVVVLAAITELGSIERFLPAIIIAGVVQILFGYFRAGELSFVVPSSVIKGMTAAIGLILILKQISHAVGYHATREGDESFQQPNRENTFSALISAFEQFSPAAIIISLTCLAAILLAEIPRIKNSIFGTALPGPLLAVIIGVVFNAIFSRMSPGFSLTGNSLVQIPVGSATSSIFTLLPAPDWTAFADPAIWKIAVMLALIASLESLLGVEAIDKLDPYRRVTPPNRELMAQGVGNICSGLIGGLPVTSVVVRSSANVQAGATSKLSGILHGALLFGLVMMVPAFLNQIPLAALAAVLMRVGYKLTSVKVFKQIFAEGASQFVPFIATVVSVLFTDLLTGVLIGIAVGLIFVVRANFHSGVTLVEYKGNYLVKLQKDVSFLNKSVLATMLESVPQGSNLLIDGNGADFIDHDILELIEDYQKHASLKDITVTTEGMTSLRHSILGVVDTVGEKNGSDAKIATKKPGMGSREATA